MSTRDTILFSIMTAILFAISIVLFWVEHKITRRSAKHNCIITKGGGTHYGDDAWFCHTCKTNKYPEVFKCPHGNKVPYDIGPRGIWLSESLERKTLRNWQLSAWIWMGLAFIFFCLWLTKVW